MNEDEAKEIVSRGESMARAFTRLGLPSDQLTATAMIGVLGSVLGLMPVTRAWIHGELDRVLNAIEQAARRESDEP